MIDASRFFFNTAAMTAVSAAADHHDEQQKNWTSEYFLDTAQRFMKRCLEYYESSPSSDDNCNSLGSLYSGSLGPRVFVRLRMAQLLLEFRSSDESSKRNSSSNSAPHDPSHTTAEAGKLLKDALDIGRNALDFETRKLQKQRRHKKIRVTLLESPYFGAKVLLAAVLAQQNKVSSMSLPSASSSISSGSRNTKNSPDAIANEIVEELHDLLGCRGDKYNDGANESLLEPGECEVLYGRAGAIQIILFLRKELNDETLGTHVVLSLARSILAEGKALAKKRQKTVGNIPLLWEWHDSYYLGAAHGIVGILQTLLSLTQAEYQSLLKEFSADNDGHDIIYETIAFLNNHLCWPSGNLQSSIHSKSKADKLVHWCHGATGHVLLLGKASAVYNDPNLLMQAQVIGQQVLWPRGLLKKGVGLCHGISGNAYAFLSLARYSSSSSDHHRSIDGTSPSCTSSLWISKAQYFANFATDHFSQLQLTPDRPYSIYEGTAGLALLFIDLASPTEARFPLYEL